MKSSAVFSSDECTCHIFIYVQPNGVCNFRGLVSTGGDLRASLLCVISLISLNYNSSQVFSLALFLLKMCLLFTVKTIRASLSESPRETHRDLGLESSIRQYHLRAGGQEEEGRPDSVKQLSSFIRLTTQIEYLSSAFGQVENNEPEETSHEH